MGENQIDRKSLIDQVATLIEMSIVLTAIQKDWLVLQLPSLGDEQLQKLVLAFEGESAKKDELIQNFFEKHPDLYDGYRRSTREVVTVAYAGIEKKAMNEEEQMMNDLLIQLNSIL